MTLVLSAFNALTRTSLDSRNGSFQFGSSHSLHSRHDSGSPQNKLTRKNLGSKHGSFQFGSTHSLYSTGSRCGSFDDDITTDEGGEVKTYEDEMQYPSSIPEDEDGSDTQQLSPCLQTRKLSCALNSLDLDNGNKDRHRLATFPSSSPSAFAESAVRAGEVAWDLPTEGGGGGDDGAAGAGDGVGGDGEEELASHTSTFSPRTADGRKSIDRPQPHGIGEEVQTEDVDPTWNDEWHTHTDELSGHTYYEHRQSGELVWASDWDAAGADADTDVATANEVAAVATEDVHEEDDDDSEQWDAHLDETSGKRYFSHRTSGAVAWKIPVQRNSEDSDGSDAAAGDALPE